MKKTKKKRKSTIFLVIIFSIGLALLLYPTIANYVNSFNASRVVTSYNEDVAKLSEEDYKRIWNSAVKYNRRLAKGPSGVKLSDKQLKDYYKQLSVGITNVIGEIEIPSIDVELPIYHGTSAAVLQTAAGHLEWTSLPVGGKSSHCVISGHRGLPSARLFTDLDQIVEGDTFRLRVLNETLTYKVDRILIVRPENIEPLKIVKGKDYCTLVTCTPYGINTHRLLIRGHRVSNDLLGEGLYLDSEAEQYDSTLVAIIIALPFIIILLLIMRKRLKRQKKEFKK